MPSLVRSLLLSAGAMCTLASAAWAQSGGRPQYAGTQYAFYEGRLHFEHGVDPVCTALTNGDYPVYFAARSGPGGIEAYMFGEKIMHARISGSDRNHLLVAFLGESNPSHPLRLQATANGFIGSVQSKTLVSELYGACTASNAEFSVIRKNADAQSAFQEYAREFQLDANSEQNLLLAQRGAIKEALPQLQEAFARKATQYSADHPQMLRYYFYLARAYEEAGLYPYSAYWYQRAAQVCVQSFGADNVCVPITALKLGQSLAFNGDPAAAEANIRHALQVADEVFGKNAPVSWVGWNALAGVLISTGRFSEAKTTLERALAFARQGPNGALNAASVEMTYAVLYRQTGQYKLAAETLRAVNATDQNSQKQAGAAGIFRQVLLAQVLNLDGQSAAAEPIARNALDLATTVLGSERPDHPALSIARVGLANIYLELGRFHEAEALYRQALENDKKYLGPNHPAVGNDEMLLAKLLRTSGDESDALPLLQDAYRISHLTRIEGLRWRVPAELMQFYGAGKLANPVLAIFYGKECVNRLQNLRSDLSHTGGGALQSFISTTEVKTLYKTLAQLLLRDGRIAEAQQVLSLLSQEELEDFSGRSMLAEAAPSPPNLPAVTGTNPAPGAPTPAPPAAATHASGAAALHPPTQVSLSKSEGELADLIANQIEVGQEYDRLKKSQQEQGDDFSHADQARLDALQAKLEEYQNKFQAAQSRIAKSAKDPQARAARSQEISAYSTAFQGSLRNLGHGAVIAQYFITEDAVEIILTTANAVIATNSAIKATKLKQLIREFRVSLSDPGRNPVPQSQQLYAVLIAPIAAALDKAGAKTLMLSLHDTLRYVPFAALNDGREFLIERMAVVNVSESALDKLGTAPKSDAWAVWGLGVTKAGRDYPALPYAGEELNNIKETLGGKSAVKLDQDFTESKLQQGLGGYYPVIHIASHFEFTPGSIDKSVLLLGDGTLLSLKQIETKLNFTGVELLTLSACETAVGDDSLTADGDEVAGLGATAQRKGAMAVIATLWPVADESTASLMNVLYRAHKVDHLDKAESLREAQLSLLYGAPGAGPGTERASAPYAHPFFWAPFILMGNWL